MKKTTRLKNRLFVLALPVMLIALKSCIYVPQDSQNRVVTKQEYYDLVRLKDSITTEYQLLQSNLELIQRETHDSLKTLNAELAVYNRDSLDAERKAALKIIEGLQSDLVDYQSALDSQRTATPDFEPMYQAQSQKLKQLARQLTALDQKLNPEVALSPAVLAQPGARFVPHRLGEYATYVVDLSAEEIDLHWQNRKGKTYSSIEKVKNSLEEEKEDILMITNGGMYNRHLSPQGLFVSHGKEEVPIDLTNGPENQFLNFYFQPNGVFLKDEEGVKVIKSTDYDSLDTRVDFATQSGPMLLIDGEIHPGFNANSVHRKLRSGVGIIDSNRVVFAISTGPVTFHEFATMFRDRFGCENALYLDGVVSRMYMPELDLADQGGPFGPIISVVGK